MAATGSTEQELEQDAKCKITLHYYGILAYRYIYDMEAHADIIYTASGRPHDGASGIPSDCVNNTVPDSEDDASVESATGIYAVYAPDVNIYYFTYY